jgi:hypothetical protein
MTIQDPNQPSLDAIALGAEFSDVEAGARYALLQRLAPALQHHLMGKFQSMGMMAALMERRLKLADPDLVKIREDCALLDSASQSALNAVVNIMSWIEPQTAATLTVNAAVTESLGMLSTELKLKHFVIVNEVPQINVELPSRALRSVLNATLIALSDWSQAPAQLCIRAEAMPDRIMMSIDLQPMELGAKRVFVSQHRLLTWRNVEILAIAESVQLTHGETGAELIFPYPNAGAVG